MAFVFKSKKDYDYKIGETNHIGPGEYLAQTKLSNLNQSKAPFMFNSSRDGNNDTKTPGPGAYYTDETYLNYLKNLYDGQQAIANDKDRVIMTKEDMMVNLKTTVEKLGFMRKDKRFKYELEENNPNIGPAFYCPELVPKYSMYKKLTKTRIDNFKGRRKGMQIRYKKNISAPSIPSSTMIGFNIKKDGELERRANPDMYLTFTGNKNDSVGPGTYELDMPSNWHRTGSQWSKSKLTRMSDSQKETSEKTMMNTKKSFDECRISNQSLTNRNDPKNTTMTGSKSFTYRTIKPKPYRNKSMIDIITRNKINQQNEHKEISTHNLNRVIEENMPGPGYYLDVDKMSSFNIQKQEEHNQFFGSRIERFNNLSKDNSNIGPGTYDYHNMSLQPKKILVPFSSNVERSPLFEEQESSIGPGAYNQQGQFDKSNSSSQIEHFGSTQKRFIHQTKLSKRDYNTPGPGSYFTIMNTTNKPFSFKWNSMINAFNKRRIGKSNSCTLISLNNHKSPGVGHYHPDLYYTIDYKNQKKAKRQNETAGVLPIAFNSTSSKMDDYIQQKSNIGPGYYFKEKMKKVNQIYPPFNHGNTKKLKEEIPQNNTVGPGKYLNDQFTDWNKKTYNINYI